MSSRAWLALLLALCACNRTRPGTPGFSNILPADYVGPEACESCHSEISESWHKHPHSKMNAAATTQTVGGDFNDAQVRYLGNLTHFRRDASGQFVMELEGKHPRKYRVTRTVGSRFMQFYIGVQTEGPEPKSDPLYSVEHKLPFAYWYHFKRWIPATYFDQMGPDVKADGHLLFDPFEEPAYITYADNCMLCHNTYPYVYRSGTQRDGLSGFPHQDHDRDEKAIRETLISLRGKGPDGEPNGHTTQDLIVMGVSCESCHFGGKAHAEKDAPIRSVPESPLLAIREGKGLLADVKNTDRVNGICAQCHTAGADLYANGAGAWNSREALDFLSGKCTSQATCLNCHNPHVGGQIEGQPDRPNQVQACLKCHAKYQDGPAATAHSKHAAQAGVSCLDCHMPRSSQGLTALVRTHHIGSPTEVSMLESAGPNACNLCHLDRSVRWTVEQLNAGWGTQLQAKPEWAAAYGGSLDTPVGQAWLKSPNQSRRLMAAQAYAASPRGPQVKQELIRALNDEAGTNRMFATLALEKLLGRPVTPQEFDPLEQPDVRAKQIANLLAAP